MSVPFVDYSAYAESYDERSTGLPGDIEFYRALAEEAAGPVVELGVGTGRTALPIAEAGVPVLGVDLAAAMLRIAAAKARARGVAHRLRLVQGDMRALALRTPAALVTIPYRAFLHNTTTADQLATLGAVHAALRPGGRLAFNVFNPNVLMIADAIRSAGTWQRGAGPRGADQRLDYEPTAQITRTTWAFTGRDGRRLRFSFNLRYVYRYEMEHLLTRMGFVVEALYGDHLRAPFQETSTEMVWVATRR